jgi:cellulose synthase/poly-beta-1,6-N-acetylglucosamine synthase-like glycosyltransferase
MATGKGEAIAWLLKTHQQCLLAFDMLVVVDADNTIDVNYLHRIRAAITPSTQVLQTFVEPHVERQSGIGWLAAASELIDQRYSDRLRCALHWPIRLRGTGMVFRTELLIDYAKRIETHVEDVALSLLLVADGIIIDQLGDAAVTDPKPLSSSAAIQQRARWFRGQWQALWIYRHEVARIMLQGLGGWSLLGSLFLRPKWVVLIGVFFLALISTGWLSFLFWGFFGLATTYYLISMLLIPERGNVIRALIHLPAFGWMWIKSIVLSMRDNSWLRTREEV